MHNRPGDNFELTAAQKEDSLRTLCMISEDHLGFTAAHTDKGPFEDRKEDNLRRPAQGPLRSTEVSTMPIEGLLSNLLRRHNEID